MAPNPVRVQQSTDITNQISATSLKFHPPTTTTIPTTGRQDVLDSPGPNNDVPHGHSNGCPPANLKREVDRRKTFINWPVPFMSPDKLAEAGFYYLRRGDLVRCVFCGIDIGRWEEGDDPMRDHLRWKPNCPFVKKMDVGNVPLGQEDVRPSTSGSSRGYDTCGPYGVEVRPFSGPDNGTHHHNNPSLETLGIHKSTGPLWKQYGTVEARLRSFALWPVSLKQKPDALTDAGFYYTGKGDQTICFHCGGGLKDWVDSDDPWVQHALWFPKCTYVVLRKGKGFIDQVLAENKAKISSKEAMDVESTSSNESLSATTTAESAKKEEEEPKASNNLCKICFTEELGVLFLPCGHIVACVKCAPSLSVCAVCRQPFTATVRAYLP